MLRIGLVCALLAGCAAPSDPPLGSDIEDAKADNGAAGPAGQTIRLQLEHGAFAANPAYPSAIVYVPTGFAATPPLNLVVFLHGFWNCAEDVVRSTGVSCTPGYPRRQAYALEQQLEWSHKNALLIVPELTYDRASSEPGNFGVEGGFRAFLGELLGKLGNVGAYSLEDVGSLVVASHSGGYRAAAGIAVRGGVNVNELWLLDSLYGQFDDFDGWVQSDLDSLSTISRRFADVYTGTAGTLVNSQAMATRAAGWVDSSVLLDDRSTATLSDADYAHGLLFKRTGLSHDGVPRYYFGKLLTSSSLPDKP
jgi:hypothetical protein